MKRKHVRLSDEIKAEFYRAFEQDDDEKIFLFFRQFLKYIENDDSPFNILLCFTNPLKDDENKEFLKCFDRTCKEFLDSRSHYRHDSSKNNTTGSAMCFIGVAHEYGLLGYDLDREKAFDHYFLSAQLNNHLGTYKLAQCHEKGIGTDVDREKALYFYRCAAKLGLTDALHTYGSILANGYLDAEVDEKTGLHYLSLAAIKANKIYPYPLFDIGRWYEKKREGQDNSAEMAYSFEVYLKGAYLNDPNCQYRVAKCLSDGELNQKKNLQKSIEWYKKAAQSGQIDAQLKLFGFHFSGINGILRRDLGIAYFWALRAGTKGCPRAVFYLGEFAMNGSGVKQDILLALWWYKIASTLGSREGSIKWEQTNREVMKRDSGPKLPPSCCGCRCTNIF